MIPQELMIALRTSGITPMHLRVIKMVTRLTDIELSTASAKEIEDLWRVSTIVISTFERAGTVHSTTYIAIKKVLDMIYTAEGYYKRSGNT